MVKDSDIIFITTTLYSPWLEIQRSIIKNKFPESKHLVINGTRNWPNAWFYWMDEVAQHNAKWFVHIDEDCFLESRQELINLIEKMEKENITLSAISDGYNHYRGANPVAINSFFMVGRIDHVINTGVDYKNVNFSLTEAGWRNSLDLLYDPEAHGKDFEYPHRIQENGSNFDYEQEPYYLLLWKLKEAGRKFYYLFPYFDERFKSTNPRIKEDSADIAIHMWYTRQWQSPMDVHGMPNFLRYKKIEKYLNGED
jgi:hypothetical protein